MGRVARPAASRPGGQAARLEIPPGMRTLLTALAPDPMTAPTVAKKVLVLQGDGIGPEVTSVAVAVARAALQPEGTVVEWIDAPFGQAAFRSSGASFPEDTVRACDAADAVLLGAVDGPESYGDTAEPCLLTLRRRLGAFANLRRVCPHPALFHASPLRAEKLVDVDILFVRELTGGIYFGEKTRSAEAASDLCVYSVTEIERVVRMACRLARERRGKVTMVDKANVLETSRLWRETSQRLVASEFPDIDYEPVLVDAMAMHLLDRARTFDVIVTENMFGDILTDEASMLAGSLGLLPSAAIGEGSKGLFEPIHGSAPDIAGEGVANPYAAVLSAAMLLRMSLGCDAAATRIERAVDQSLTDEVWTRDIGGTATTSVVQSALLARL